MPNTGHTGLIISIIILGFSCVQNIKKNKNKNNKKKTKQKKNKKPRSTYRPSQFSGQKGKQTFYFLGRNDNESDETWPYCLAGGII